jgi:hypothetical protein
MNPQVLESMQTAITIMTVLNLAWTIGNIISVIVTKVKAPNVRQDGRITSLETRTDRIEKHLDNDNKRLQEIEKGNRITQQSILALMRHAIDGNNIDQLREAESNMQEYLIQK